MAAYKAVSLVAIVCALFGTEVKSVSRRYSRPSGPKAHYRSSVVDGDRTSTSSEFYILTVQVNIGQQGGLDLPAVMCKLNQLLYSYTDVARCLHKYKVCKQGSMYMLSETNLMGFPFHQFDRLVSTHVST